MKITKSQLKQIITEALEEVPTGIPGTRAMYAICAGIIGKQKKIIHSKKWVESRVQLQDKFWCDLYDGGNEDYKIWRII